MTETNRNELALLIDPNALELEAYPWPLDAADRVLNSEWLRKVQADAFAEGFASCAYWWEIHHFESVSTTSNPYLAEYRN